MKKKTISKVIWVLDKVDVALILTDLTLTEIADANGLKLPTLYRRILSIAKRYGVEPDLKTIRKTVPNKPEFKRDLLASIITGELGISLQDIIKFRNGDTDESISNKDDYEICKN